MGRKHCGLRRNCSLPTISLISHLPTVFSTGLFPRGVKGHHCENIVRKGEIACFKQFLLFLQTKSVTKKEMNKCMAEIYDPGGTRTRAANTITTELKRILPNAVVR